MSEPWSPGAGESGRTDEVVDVLALADELLERAQRDLQRKATAVVVKGPYQRAVLMALQAGAQLPEHASPPAATLHVLRGRVRLHDTSGAEWIVAAGSLVPIPPERHAVDALEDSAFLLTVSLTGPTPA